MHLFCFGLGYSAKVISNNLDSSWKVSGSHTNKEVLGENEYIFNNEEKFNSSILDDVTHILISIPPDAQGDPVFLSYGTYIKALPNLKWVGYFSSTAVYGDYQGEWVNELSETKASEPSGKNRLLAENQWLESGLPVNIVRLSSIYGPGRSTIDAVKEGRAARIYKENQFFSRIHVDDIAQLTILLMTKPNLNQIFNFADDFPCAQHEVVEFACSLLKVNPPEMINYIDANLSEAMQRFYNSSKKVDNRKIKEVYNYKFTFPSYREGLLKC